MAGLIDNAIGETGDPPPILSVLPAAGLVPGGFIYFHHYIWLNSYYFITTDNILEMDENTPAVLAKYGLPDERLYLLVIEYPDTVKADRAFSTFGRHFFPEGLTGNCTQMEDKTWLAAGMFHRTLVAVFNAAEREKAMELLKRTEDCLK